MGFINDVRRIAKETHTARQTALFSATMPPEIEQLAQSLLRAPVRVEVAPQSTTAAEINQSIVLARTKQKRHVLAKMLANPDMSSVLVFSRTKHGADRITKDLERDGFNAGVIHGNKSQNARQKALNEFKGGKVRILVATDIAARGIDVVGISHVVNFDLPDEAESYVHRIGRTGRNGASGVAVTLVDPSENAKLRSVERIIRMKLPVAANHLAEADPQREPRSHEPSEAAGEREERRQPGGRNERRPHRNGEHHAAAGKPNGGRNGNAERPRNDRPQFAKPAGDKPEGRRPFRGKRRGFGGKRAPARAA
jgi:ATP-dependent RNA helicase RhlE